MIDDYYCFYCGESLTGESHRSLKCSECGTKYSLNTSGTNPIITCKKTPKALSDKDFIQGLLNSKGTLPMYERPGCSSCHNGQKYSGGATELSVTYYDRCRCSKVYSNDYFRFQKIADEGAVSLLDYRKIKGLFKDNNNHIHEGSNAADRSW